MSNTAADRLRRLLTVLPHFADQRDHSIDELAGLSGTTAKQMLSDLQSLCHRFDEPAGFMESVQVLIERDRVSVITNHFMRPMRLSASELCALELGLAILVHEIPETDRHSVQELRERLATLITRLPQDRAYEGLRHGSMVSGNEATALAAVRKALTRRCALEIHYQAPSDAAARVRVVRPYQLMFSRGSWFMIGFCELSNAERLFRADRILEARMLEQTCEVPDGFQLESLIYNDVPLVMNGEPDRLVVRYGPGVARWIAERDGQPLESDGSALRTMPLFDREWAIRHVLQYGPDAWIEEPAELQMELVKRLAEF